MIAEIKISFQGSCYQLLLKAMKKTDCRGKMANMTVAKIKELLRDKKDGTSD
jgi:hypothetical protein